MELKVNLYKKKKVMLIILFDREEKKEKSRAREGLSDSDSRSLRQMMVSWVLTYTEIGQSFLIALQAITKRFEIIRSIYQFLFVITSSCLLLLVHIDSCWLL
jgi:hypothetical protein